MSSSSDQHRAAATQQGQVPLAIVTVSDTRTPESDVNGAYLREQIAAAGHRVVAYRIVKDEVDQVLEVLDELAAGEARVILYNGGTGISPRDCTYDALSLKLEKVLSYQQVGAAAMLSRATAGVYRNTIIVSTPGSPAAVQLAWEKLIAPELTHLAWEALR